MEKNKEEIRAEIIKNAEAVERRLEQAIRELDNEPVWKKWLAIQEAEDKKILENKENTERM